MYALCNISLNCNTDI